MSSKPTYFLIILWKLRRRTIVHPYFSRGALFEKIFEFPSTLTSKDIGCTFVESGGYHYVMYGSLPVGIQHLTSTSLITDVGILCGPSWNKIPIGSNLAPGRNDTTITLVIQIKKRKIATRTIPSHSYCVNNAILPAKDLKFVSFSMEWRRSHGTA